MFLLQRLIGVGVYTLCLAWFVWSIPQVKGLRIHLAMYCFILGLMGFFYVPLNGSDLGRVQLAMMSYAGCSWGELVDRMLNSSSPMAILYYRLVAGLGDKRMLPFVTAILTYGFCFSLLVYSHKRYQCRKAVVSLALFFFMSRGLLMMTIANIRTMLSLSLVAYAIYLYFIERRSFLKCAIVMLIGALLQNVGMLASMLFVAFYIVKGAKGRSRILTVIEGAIVIGIAAVYGRTFILGAAEKGLKYLSYTKGFFYIWEMLLSLMVIAASYFIMLQYRKSFEAHALVSAAEGDALMQSRSLVQFQAFIAAVSFVLLFIEFNSGLRLSWLLTILDMPMIVIVLSDPQMSSVRKKQINEILFTISIIMLFVACARGDLCSLKFA